MLALYINRNATRHGRVFIDIRISSLLQTTDELGAHAMLFDEFEDFR